MKYYITKKEWDSTFKDYKSVKNGQKYVLKLNDKTGATELVPVYIKESTKISRNKLKEIVKSTVLENTEYETFFQKALSVAGKSIPEMSDEEKKSFFNKIDAAWDAKGEKKEATASVNESDDDKYTHVGYGNYKLKGKEKDSNAIVFSKDKNGKYVANTNNDNSKTATTAKSKVNIFNKAPEKKSTIDYNGDAFKLGTPAVYTHNNTKYSGEVIKNPKNQRLNVNGVWRMYGKGTIKGIQTYKTNDFIVPDNWNEVKSFSKSTNEGISVFDERHIGKDGIIIMIDDAGKKYSVIFKNKKNADKYNRNNPSDIAKLLQLAKNTKYPKAIDAVVNEGATDILKNGGLKQWWKYSPEDVVSFIYWTKRQIPPADAIKQWPSIKKQLQKKFPQSENEINESLNEGKFKKDDLVYNKRTNMVSIVRVGDDKHGEVKTDNGVNVNVDELEKFNPIKNKHHENARVARDTGKEIENRRLFNPFKNESVNESKLLGKKGDYSVTSNNGVIQLHKKGTIVLTGDYDSGSRSFWLSLPGKKGQTSFEEVDDILNYAIKNKLSENNHINESNRYDVISKQYKNGRFKGHFTLTFVSPKAKAYAKQRNITTTDVKGYPMMAGKQVDVDKYHVYLKQKGLSIDTYILESVNEGDTTNSTLMINIENTRGIMKWFFKKIDSTHFFMANSEKALTSGAAMVHHVGQHRGETYYNDLKDWLHGKIDTNKLQGKKYKGIY